MKKLFQKTKHKINSDKASIALTQNTIETALHRTCKSLSIHSFIQAHCNNDLSGLIITGNPSSEELHSAWNEILFEYSSLIKNTESEYTFDLAHQISMLKWHINYVDNAIIFLRLRYDEDIAKELIELGYDISSDFNYDPESDYQKKLDLSVSLCKTRVFDLDLLTDEYDRLTNTLGGKKQTEEDYERTLAMLSKFQSYHIDAFTTSVFRFTIIFNNYLAAMKAREKINAE